MKKSDMIDVKEFIEFIERKPTLEERIEALERMNGKNYFFGKAGRQA